MIDPEQHDPEYLLSVSAVADLFGRTPRMIRYWISEGFFPNARKIGNAYAIPWKDIVTHINKK